MVKSCGSPQFMAQQANDVKTSSGKHGLPPSSSAMQSKKQKSEKKKEEVSYEDDDEASVRAREEFLQAMKIMEEAGLVTEKGLGAGMVK